MSGHSKWANIRVRKGAQDARKGKVYTKYARLIEIAAREGGADPTANVRLRSLIDAAKAESVPNANIDRAIKKGSGDLKGEAMQEITYEAYGPGGSAFIIECLTDNKNRTLSNVKTILDKNGGRFAGSGSVMWLFDRKGVIEFQVSDVQSAGLEDVELALMDVGIDDFFASEGSAQVVTDVGNWPKVRDFLKDKAFVIESAGLKFVAKQRVDIDASLWEKVEVLMTALESDDDVSEVYTNARPESQA